MRIRTAVIATALSLALGTTAGAFAPGPKTESPLETGAGTMPARSYRSIVHVAPAHARAALDRVAAAGLANVLWDRDTDVAAQLWGAGIDAPRSIANADAAEAAARSFLAEHLGVLAPGSALTDFTLHASAVRDDRRMVVLQQHRDGLVVVGAHISFVFKHDRLVIVSSTALPDVTTSVTGPALKAELVRDGARQWITSVTGRAAQASDLGEDAVLPIIHRRTRNGPDIEYHVVQPVKVALTGAAGTWEVFIDRNAQPIARRSLLRYGTGTVQFNVPERYPGGTRSLFAAAFANHTVNGAPATATAAGEVTWTGTAAATVLPGLVGTKVRMHSSGALAATSLTLPNGGAATWDENATATKDAQLTSYIHANVVKAWVKANLTTSIPWVDQQLDVYVNESGSCNAYSTGDDIHFFPADSQCENTGRISDVVYHEFGHSLQAHASISGGYDGDLGEGQADFLAAMITNDHGMGRGFFFSNAPLRDLDPSGTELVYPDDVTGEVHADGEIIGQALWDMRKALIASLGEAAGNALTQKIYLEVIETSDTIPGCYAAALAADDDDGNLGNGTPNQCTIQGAFGLHGLADAESLSAGVGLPTAAGLAISVPVTPPPSGTCPAPSVVSGTLAWHVRGAGSPETLTLVEMDTGSGNSSWSATIPNQPDSTVVNYRLTLTLSNGNILSYPDNPADPDYELYVGQIEEIWCDDFEAGLGQWTHGFDAGADEWEAAPPQGLAEDPQTAFEGANVMGIDLTANGEYRRDTNEWALSPVIDVTGKDGVRLQYQRWLGVEDGFFDHATISVDGSEKWSNLNSDQGNGSNVTHKDKEWRFQDVDLGDEAADGSVQVEFRLESDPGLQFGGWTMDRVCIVGRLAGGVCGDGTTAGVEQCDDMNTEDGDGCSSTCQDETPGDDEPGPGGCCSTGSGPGGPILLGLMTVGALVRRRRRRA